GLATLVPAGQPGWWWMERRTLGCVHAPRGPEQHIKKPSRRDKGTQPRISILGVGSAKDENRRRGGPQDAVRHPKWPPWVGGVSTAPLAVRPFLRTGFSCPKSYSST